MKAVLNGSQTVFQQTYAAVFSDPTVQAADATADGILVGDDASPHAPVQTSTSTVLQSSQTNTVQVADGNATITTLDTFGPNVIQVGDNQSDTFTIVAG